MTTRMRAFTLAFAFHLALGVTARADHPSVSLGSGGAQAINTESAIPLDHGTWSLGVRTEYVRFREFSDARLLGLRRRHPEADLHSVESLLATSLGVFYGVTDDLTLGIRLPWIRRTGIREPGHDRAGGIDHLGSVDGFGDLGLFGQWRFLERRPWHLALLAGLDLPTGETSARASSGERVETEFQPGSGSLDGLVGLAATRAAGPVSLDASALYTVAGDGSRDTNLGDVLAWGLALSHRFGGEHHHDGHHHHHAAPHLLWDVFLELNGEWREEQVAGGVRDGNSGGSLLWLGPGARLTMAGRVSIAASVGVPVWTGLNGDQVTPSVRVVTSVGMAF